MHPGHGFDPKINPSGSSLFVVQEQTYEGKKIKPKIIEKFDQTMKKE